MIYLNERFLSQKVVKFCAKQEENVFDKLTELKLVSKKKKIYVPLG